MQIFALRKFECLDFYIPNIDQKIKNGRTRGRSQSKTKRVERNRHSTRKNNYKYGLTIQARLISSAV
jgi:hypothetical protein